MSLISVIVPVYNVEKFLCDCIDSIIGQTYSNLEIILVDDGSTDASGRICDEYAMKDERIRVIHTENRGVSAARNMGIDEARGDYLVFVDSDDYIVSHMIEILYHRLRQDASDMVVCNIWVVDEKHKMLTESNRNMPIEDELIGKKEAFQKLVVDGWYYASSCNKLYQKHIFNELRFPNGQRFEDEFLMPYIIDNCKLISCVKEPLYYYVQQQGGFINGSYTIGKLDAVAAFMDRVNFFHQKKYDDLASTSLVHAMFRLATAYNELGRTKEVKERLREWKNIYNGWYFRTLKHQITLKRKIQTTLFFVSPRLFSALFLFRHSLSKKLQKGVKRWQRSV